MLTVQSLSSMYKITYIYWCILVDNHQLYVLNEVQRNKCKKCIFKYRQSVFIFLLINLAQETHCSKLLQKLSKIKLGFKGLGAKEIRLLR